MPIYGNKFEKAEIKTKKTKKEKDPFKLSGNQARRVKLKRFDNQPNIKGYQRATMGYNDST